MLFFSKEVWYTHSTPAGEQSSTSQLVKLSLSKAGDALTQVNGSFVMKSM